MSRRKSLACVILPALAAAQTDIFKYAAQIPQCGIACILQEAPASVCHGFGNATCLCTDPAFLLAAQTCVLSTCEKPLDAIQTAKIEALACERPIRDRRADLTPPFVLQLVSFVAVWTRLYARWTVSASFQNDDWMMLVCAVLYTPSIVVGQYGGRLAFGRDVWTVDIADITTGLRVFYIGQPFYLLLLGLTKVSLLCFLLRIFPNQNFRWATYSIILVTALSTAIYIFLGLFQCMPVAYNWEGWKGGFGDYRCLQINTLVLSAAGFSIALDIVIMVLPIPLLVRLNMSWRSKAKILFMFSLGIFIIITACLRLRYIIRFSRSFNPTWDDTDVIIWSALEVAVSVIVTSLPAIHTLLVRSVPRIWSAFLSRTGLSGGRWAKKSDTDTGTHRPLHSLAQDRDAPPRLPRQPLAEPFHIALVPRFSNQRVVGWPRTASEGAPELGDRARDDLYTEITATEDDRADGLSGGPLADILVQQSSIESGIQVQITTRIASEEGRRQYRGRGEPRICSIGKAM